MPRPLDNRHAGRSEYDATRGPAGIEIKGADAMEAADKMRMQRLTGTEDPDAPVDRRVWEGLDPAKWDALEARYPKPDGFPGSQDI